MTQKLETAEQAVNVLLQGVQLAQKRGAYDLTEAALLSSAATFLTNPPQPVSESSSVDETYNEESEKQHSEKSKKNT